MRNTSRREIHSDEGKANPQIQIVESGCPIEWSSPKVKNSQTCSETEPWIYKGQQNIITPGHDYVTRNSKSNRKGIVFFISYESELRFTNVLEKVWIFATKGKLKNRRIVCEIFNIVNYAPIQIAFIVGRNLLPWQWSKTLSFSTKSLTQTSTDQTETQVIQWSLCKCSTP